MAIRERALLKSWFKRGAYPKAEQFADWIDSFFHKSEDQILISQVEDLADHLNGKYSALSGKELERQYGELRKDFNEHEEHSETLFNEIIDDIDILEDVDERQQEEIDVLENEVDNIHKKDAEQDKVIAEQQTQINVANGNSEQLRKCLHPTAVFDSLESTFTALGTDYSTLWALANTLKTFLEANDTANSTINTWKEIEAFLQGITDTQSLTALLNDLKSTITTEYTAVVEAEKERAEAVEETKVNTDDPRLSDARQAAGGYAESISNHRDATQHYTFWVGSKSQFDALPTKDNTTIYHIV